MTELPRGPVTRDQTYLAVIVERLDRLTDLLTEIRDRLPSPQGGEPVTSGQPEQPEQVEIAEPAAPTPAGAGEQVTEPAAPKKRTPAKRTGTPKTSGRSGTAARGRATQPKKGS